MRIVAYYRVSTAKQGRSGLGLEAQTAAVEAYAGRVGGTITAAFTEVESGKTNDRPQLTQALHLAKVTGATLVIAKLDRLSRNAAFLITLRDSGCRFVAADMPDACELTVGIMALVAEQERKAISRRTREALQAAKARGQRLGNPNGAAALRRAAKGNAASREAAKVNADRFAQDRASVVAQLQEAGVVSLGAIAAALNKRGITTPRGGQWHRSTVRNLLGRLTI
ncbi:recombinase family protein [Geminicoccus harenae]|uniref:recombinase family protein n=1 Tax=Geminicoccus harenae TaxID=2498453 RepID=UPI00168C0500|nr:recombinase family protein [Geminicoccus harenae]